MPYTQKMQPREQPCYRWCIYKGYFLEFSNSSLNVEKIHLHVHRPLPLHHMKGNLGIKLNRHTKETSVLAS